MSDRPSQLKNDRPGLLTRLMLRYSASKRIDGLWIGSFEDKPEAELRRVTAALDLIKTCDPQRYRRLTRDLERVWVTIIAGGRAQFDPTIWTCVLDARYVLNETTALEEIATSIVHEATHARLYRCGFGYEEGLRSRVEAVCFRRERAFARKLPNGEQIRELADRKLVAYAGQTYWTNEAFHTRYEEGAIEALRYLHMPRWPLRIFQAIKLLRLRFAGTGCS
jgi:hypothetical protein